MRQWVIYQRNHIVDVNDRVVVRVEKVIIIKEIIMEENRRMIIIGNKKTKDTKILIDIIVDSYYIYFNILFILFCRINLYW